jgi:hypothetical protein
LKKNGLQIRTRAFHRAEVTMKKVRLAIRSKGKGKSGGARRYHLRIVSGSRKRHDRPGGYL